MQCLRTLMVLPVLLLLPISATADEPANTEQTAADDTEVMVDLGAFGEDGSLSDEQLNSHRARENIELEQITLNNQDQDGDVTDNIAIGTTNGDNMISGEAFSNSAGFLSTVQNTGNNVLIQNSTIINVEVDTPAN